MDDDRPVGNRRVFEGPEGPYVESAPGAGPRHPDDVPATPETTEARARGTGVGAEWDADMAAGMPGWTVPGPDAPNGYLVIGRGMHSAWAPNMVDAAHAHARAIGGMVLAAPVIADYSTGERASGG